MLSLIGTVTGLPVLRRLMLMVFCFKSTFTRRSVTRSPKEKPVKNAVRIIHCQNGLALSCSCFTSASVNARLPVSFVSVFGSLASATGLRVVWPSFCACKKMLERIRLNPLVVSCVVALRFSVRYPRTSSGVMSSIVTGAASALTCALNSRASCSYLVTVLCARYVFAFASHASKYSATVFFRSAVLPVMAEMKSAVTALAACACSIKFSRASSASAISLWVVLSDFRISLPFARQPIHQVAPRLLIHAMFVLVFHSGLERDSNKATLCAVCAQVKSVHYPSLCVFARKLNDYAPC